jgi:hypothetical protein
MSHVEARSEEPSSGMNASDFPLGFRWRDVNAFILSRYVLELRVNAIIDVGSFSRMMTFESAKRCSEADLIHQRFHACSVSKGLTRGTPEA